MRTSSPCPQPLARAHSSRLPHTLQEADFSFRSLGIFPCVVGSKFLQDSEADSSLSPLAARVRASLGRPHTLQEADFR